MAITVGGVLFTNVDARGHCSNFALLRIGLKFFYRRQVGFLRRFDALFKSIFWLLNQPSAAALEIQHGRKYASASACASGIDTT